MSENNNRNVITGLRWLGRIGSLVSIGFLCAFAFGGDENLRFQSVGEFVGFAFFPIGIVVGMLMAWRWELLGGTVTVASLVLFYVWHVSRAGNFPSGPYFLLFALPGIVLLGVGLAVRSKNTS